MGKNLNGEETVNFHVIKPFPASYSILQLIAISGKYLAFNNVSLWFTNEMSEYFKVLAENNMFHQQFIEDINLYFNFYFLLFVLLPPLKCELCYKEKEMSLRRMIVSPITTSRDLLK